MYTAALYILKLFSINLHSRWTTDGSLWARCLGVHCIGMLGWMWALTHTKWIKSTLDSPMPRWGIHVQCTYYVHIVPEHMKTGCRVCCTRYKLHWTCTLLYLWHVSILVLFCTCSCQTDIDECVNATCLNNATCVDLVNGFDCNCTDEYFGDQCEISVSVACVEAAFLKPRINLFLCYIHIYIYSRSISSTCTYYTPSLCVAHVLMSHNTRVLQLWLCTGIM